MKKLSADLCAGPLIIQCGVSSSPPSVLFDVILNITAVGSEAKSSPHSARLALAAVEHPGPNAPQGTTDGQKVACAKKAAPPPPLLATLAIRVDPKSHDCPFVSLLAWQATVYTAPPCTAAVFPES